MKFSKIILIMALAFAMLFCVVACDTDEPVIPEQDEQAGDTPTDTSDPQESESGTEAQTPAHKIHIDAKPQDGKCDVCQAYVPCPGCVDANPKDAKCDVCGKDVPCTTCVDVNPKNAKCDVCGKDVPCTTCVDVNPKNAKCDVCGKDVPCTTCVDVNPKNAKCDVCGKNVSCTPCVDDKNGLKDGKCDVCGKAYTHDPIDNSFEETAKQYLANHQGAIGITQISDINIISPRLPGSMRAEQLLVQRIDANGSIYQVQQMNSYKSYAGEEAQLSSNDTTVIQIGTDFYVTTYQTKQGEKPLRANILVSATQNEIDNLENQLTEDVNPELAHSVNHFRAVNISSDDDGNTVYICYGLRKESAEAYEQLCENMANATVGQNVTFTLDPNSLVYKVTVNEEGRITHAELSMDVSAVIDSESVLYEMTSIQEYTYEIDEIEAPEVDNNWFGMTLTEYFGMAHPENACTGSHTDDNENAFCDACGTVVANVIPHLGECSDGEDDTPGLCDKCGKPITQ